MTMSGITRSVSLHSSYFEYLSTKVLTVFKEWGKQLPYVHPCYSVSSRTTPELVSVLRTYNITMVCHNAKEVKLVNNASLTMMEGRRLGYHECIVRTLKTLQSKPPSAPIWIHTTISSAGVDYSKEMFEHIWANKHILNGIVFNISNFTHPTHAIPPSMYSYKVGMDYVIRNIVDPFKSDYGISTPAIMMDGRSHVTQLRHLFELHEYALSRSQPLWEKTGRFYSRPKLYLLVDELLDTSIHKN